MRQLLDDAAKNGDGIAAFNVDNLEQVQAVMAAAEKVLVARGVLMPGDTYAITCGEPMGYPGGTNMLKVCRVG